MLIASDPGYQPKVIASPREPRNHKPRVWARNSRECDPRFRDFWTALEAAWLMPNGGQIVRDLRAPGRCDGVFYSPYSAPYPNHKATPHGIGVECEDGGGSSSAGIQIYDGSGSHHLGTTFTPEQLTLSFFGYASRNNDPRMISKQSSGVEQDHDWMVGAVTTGGDQQGQVRGRLGTNSTTSTIYGLDGTEVPFGSLLLGASIYDGATYRLSQNGAPLYLNGNQWFITKTGTVDATSGLGVMLLQSSYLGATNEWDEPILWAAIHSRALNAGEFADLWRDPFGPFRRRRRVFITVPQHDMHYEPVTRIIVPSRQNKIHKPQGKDVARNSKQCTEHWRWVWNRATAMFLLPECPLQELVQRKTLTITGTRPIVELTALGQMAHFNAATWLSCSGYPSLANQTDPGWTLFCVFQLDNLTAAQVTLLRTSDSNNGLSIEILSAGTVRVRFHGESLITTTGVVTAGVPWFLSVTFPKNLAGWDNVQFHARNILAHTSWDENIQYTNDGLAGDGTYLIGGKEELDGGILCAGFVREFWDTGRTHLIARDPFGPFRRRRRIMVQVEKVWPVTEIVSYGRRP
jgi:hypothetical protein